MRILIRTDPDADPDPTPDPAFFVLDLQQQQNFLLVFMLTRIRTKKLRIRILVCTFTSFFKDKTSQNCRNQGFSYYFCLMMQGPRAGSESGCVLVTNRSRYGSGRPKTYGSGTLPYIRFLPQIHMGHVNGM
jgi:hypothetical protein